MRHGVTLLELIIIVVVLGVMLAVAAPSLMPPAQQRDSQLAAVIATARRAALVRGEPVTVSFDAGGRWRLEVDASPSATLIARGNLVPPIGRLRVRISSAGTCVAEAIDELIAPVMDAVGCAAGPAGRAAQPLR
jgi:Tfp pilus assembly protein FimT